MERVGGVETVQRFEEGEESRHHRLSAPACGTVSGVKAGS